MDRALSYFILFALQEYKRFVVNADKPGQGIFIYIRQILEEYWHFIILIISSTLCSYFAKLSCKLCMQFAGFAVPLMLAGPTTVSTR